MSKKQILACSIACGVCGLTILYLGNAVESRELSILALGFGWIITMIGGLFTSIGSRIKT
jgi:hypothetical protein